VQFVRRAVPLVIDELRSNANGTIKISVMIIGDDSKWAAELFNNTAHRKGQLRPPEVNADWLI
jgi:hypothetical protein